MRYQVPLLVGIGKYNGGQLPSDSRAKARRSLLAGNYHSALGEGKFAKVQQLTDMSRPTSTVLWQTWHWLGASRIPMYLASCWGLPRSTRLKPTCWHQILWRNSLPNTWEAIKAIIGNGPGNKWGNGKRSFPTV